MTPSKRDANERPILRGLRDIGAWYHQMDRDAGFDLLVGFRGRLFVGEVKDPAQPPSKRQRTVAEQITVAELELVDVPCPIWQTLDDVLRDIGAM